MNHTSAPWYYIKSTRITNSGVQVGNYGFSVLNDDDAKLIAASPELYEIVQKLAQMMEDAGYFPDTSSEQVAIGDLGREARALLDKIEGGVA